LAPVYSIAFSSDGKTLATASRCRTSEFKQPLGVWKGSYYLDWAAGDTSQAIRVWDVATRRQRAEWAPPAFLECYSLALSPDSGTLAGGCSGGAFVLWDVATSRQRAMGFVRPGDRAYWQNATLWGWLFAFMPKFGPAVQAVAWSPQGVYFATATADGLVQLWDSSDGKELRTLPGQGAAQCLAFSPDGNGLAVGRGKRVELWDVSTGRLRRVLDGPAKAVWSLAFSPDGVLLAAGGADWRIRLWEVANGTERGPLLGHQERVAGLAFAPDGRLLASAGWDGTVRLWHVATARELFALEGHRGKVHCVDFAPDGNTLASGGETPEGSGEVLLWRAAPDVTRDL
jgi:hypothetical protein